MEIEFASKIDFEEPIDDFNCLVVPTDRNLSGSSGIDKIIQAKLGDTLRAELKKHPDEEYGNAFYVSDNSLTEKGLIFAVTPPKKGYDAEKLQECYSCCLTEAAEKSGYHEDMSLAIPLLGTGSRGWSKEESMAALWNAIKDLNLFSMEKINRLIIYRGNDYELDKGYENRFALAFLELPRQWGLRGSPYLWKYLMEYFGDREMTSNWNPYDFFEELKETWQQQCGVSLLECDRTYVEKFAHGGMSSGYVEGEWWRTVGIPLLFNNLSKLYCKRNIAMTVDVKIGGEKYSLLYPMLEDIQSLLCK